MSCSACVRYAAVRAAGAAGVSRPLPAGPLSHPAVPCRPIRTPPQETKRKIQVYARVSTRESRNEMGFLGNNPDAGEEDLPSIREQLPHNVGVACPEVIK